MQMKNILQVTALLFLCAGIASATCNPSYVHQSGRVITVLPTNSDDTENLQCAFNLGSHVPGAVIQLMKGTYITGRIKVDGFVGVVRGKGMNATIIRNPNTAIYVTPDDSYMVPPESDASALPYLFVLLGGDYTFTDLTVSIVGAEPATDWSIFGIRQWLGHGITSLAGPFVVLGSPTGHGCRKADAAFYRVKLKGEATNDPLYGFNIYNGIFYEGFSGPELQPLKGTFSVHESVFESVASAAPVSNLRNSRISISGNTIRNGFYGSDAEDLRDTLYEFAHNNVAGVIGLQMFDNCLGGEANCGMQGSELIVRNNTFQTTDGVLIDATYTGANSTLLVGNDFTGVTGVGVRLGPTTTRCLVVLSAPTTVQDLGTNNVVIGPRQSSSKKSAQVRSLWQMGKHH